MWALEKEPKSWDEIWKIHTNIPLPWPPTSALLTVMRPLLLPPFISDCTRHPHTETHSFLVFYCHPASTLPIIRKVVQERETSLKHSHRRFDHRHPRYYIPHSWASVMTWRACWNYHRQGKIIRPCYKWGFDVTQRKRQSKDQKVFFWADLYSQGPCYHPDK